MALTPEQQQREKILIELCNMMPMFDPSQYDEIVNRGVIWLHFTDWVDRFDRDLLIKEGILFQRHDLKYEERGGWRDDFPPTAYGLTAKAKGILNHRREWVLHGNWSPSAEEVDSGNRRLLQIATEAMKHVQL